MPKTMPVRNEMPSVNSRTRGSISICLVRDVNRAMNVVSIDRVDEAKMMPTTPPASERTTLSVSSWRTSCPRPAPSAARTASSRSRRSSRASDRLATFEQAMSRTKLVVPSRMSSSGRAWRVSSLRTESVVAVKPDEAAYAPGLAAAKRWQTARTSAVACSWVTPGFSRPKTPSAAKTRRFWPMRRSAAARNGHADTDM